LATLPLSGFLELGPAPSAAPVSEAFLLASPVATEVTRGLSDAEKGVKCVV